MAKIIDVANKAGVSTATVSRALNGSSMVSEETKKIVIAAAEELGYQLSPRAQKEIPERIICVVSALPTQELDEAIIRSAVEKNYSAVFLKATNDKQDEYYINGTIRMLEKQIAGVIMVGDPSWFTGIRFDIPAGINTVSVLENYKSDTAYIGSDSLRIGYDAAEYLIRQQGCRRIATVAAAGDRPGVSMMLRGYQLALLEHDLPFNKDLMYTEIIQQRFDGRDPVPALVRQIRSAEPPDGIFCVIDLLADDIVKALSETRLKVPDDVKLITVSRSSFFQFDRSYPYAKIEHDYEQIGREAVNKLCMADGSGYPLSGQKTLIPHRLIEQ